MKPAILKPQVSIGDVLIGDNIENYPTRQFQHEDEVEGEVFRYFRFTDSTISAFALADGQIESLSCDQECLWKDTNLIGLEYSKFVEMETAFPDEMEQITIEAEEGEQVQDVYDYDALGLQLWVFEGKIVTVIASNYEGEEEDDDAEEEV